MRKQKKTSKTTLLKFAIAISIMPFLWLITQPNRLGGLQYAGGNIIGLIAAVLLWWQFVMGIRFIARFMTPDYVEVITLHKSLGKWGGGLALVHPVWQMVLFSETFSFLFTLNFAEEFQKHLSLGRLAFILLIVVWVTSAILRSKMAFRPWMYIHYLTYPMMGFIFLHAYEIGTFLQVFPILTIYWFGLMGTFFLMVLYRVIVYFNIGKSAYRLIDKKTVGKEITVYTFEALGKPLVPKVGQFIFLKARSVVGEEHPFSVMTSEENGRILRLGIKNVGLFTKKLSKLAVGSKVYLDGPYGVFTTEAQSSSPKVLIAGGIGITPFVDLVKKYGNDKTYLFYANKDYNDAVFRTSLKSSLGHRYVEAVSQDIPSDKMVVRGRLTVDVLRQKLTPAVLAEAEFFVCGSPAFMKGMNSLLSTLGITKDKIHTEEFGL